MIEINWSDVWQTLDSLKNYFIALGIIAAACVIAMIACAKQSKPERFLVRAHGGMLILVSLILVVNIICTGPMYTLLSLASGNGSLSQETSDASLALAGQISDEGIVLLQNDQDLLPLTGSDNINVFGWASTNPVYGGTGSGSLNDAYHTVSLLEGLANAGFQTNTELSDFYTAYRADRPAVGMWAQEWTLPEPPANTYSADLMNSAKSFSDTALIVFSRPGGDQFVPGAPVHFVDYVEGIYVGYKYYETAAEEGFIDYDELVQYPFGHGLSYTTFSQEMGAISESNGAISFDVTVTNTDNVAGKDVVQVYYNPPYTNGGIEKASANLVAFDKTDELAPGASQTLTISFNVEDMASYDMSRNGRYVLEDGDYIISINSDSHNIIDSQTYTVSSDVDYSAGRSTDLTAPANLFDFADGGLTYLSRADGFANFAQATAALNNNFTQVGSVGFPSSVMIACTWNEDLARAFGEGIADMADDMDVSGWYAPAMNIHRTPFAGRNFEYYSEDGFLSGRIASQAAQGASDNGGDSCLINRDMVTNNVTDTGNPLTVQQMRRACKNILYVAVNSRDYTPENLNVGGLMSWQIILIVVDVLLAAAVIALEVVIFKAYQKKAVAVK